MRNKRIAVAQNNQASIDTAIKATYGLKVLLLNSIILILFVVLSGLVAVSVYFAHTAYSAPVFTEISPDGSGLIIPDSRKMLEDWIPNDVIQERFIKNFIQDMRQVPNDANVIYNSLMRLMYRTSGQAQSAMMNYISENNPGTRMNSYIVEVPYERIELSRYEDNIWKVFWTERVYLKSTGELLSDRKYEAVLYIGFHQSKDDTVRTWNPTGMYVTYMDSDLYRSLV